jgi:hypothetical protein
MVGTVDKHVTQSTASVGFGEATSDIGIGYSTMNGSTGSSLRTLTALS